MNQIEMQKLSDDIQRIGNRAVKKAQADNHAKGLPNVYSKNGVIYWQLPDGTITMKSPFEVEEKAEVALGGVIVNTPSAR